MAFVSLQSSNFRDRVIRHQAFLGELSRKVDLIGERDKEDATFDMRELGGNLVQFFAVNFPSHVLRHQDLRIKLSELRFDISAPGTSPAETAEHRLTRVDSTFARLPGLFDSNGVSFQATNIKGPRGQPFFIRHRDFHLVLEQLIPPPDPENAFDPPHELFNAQARAADQFREDATFFIVGPLVQEQFPHIG